MKPEAFIILTPGFAANEDDSTCIPSQQIFLRSLKQQFPRLNVIILSFQYPFIAKEYSWNGCRVITLGGKERSKLFRLLTWQKAWRKLKLLHKQYEITGMLSFWCGECAFIGKRFGNKYSILHKCWLQGQDAKKDNKYVKRIKPKPEEIIALSDFLAIQFYQNYSVSPANTITIGIDPDFFINTNLERTIDIIGVGSLIPLKQYAVFIDRIKHLKNDHPDIKTMIVGKGPEEKKLQLLIKENGLQNNIILTGELPHTDVLQLMQRSKILLHTSAYEGFGAVCIEALYAGCKVVSFIRPMKQDIKNWHTVNTDEEMMGILAAILKSGSVNNVPVIPFLMADSVKQMMQLFNYKEAATS